MTKKIIFNENNQKEFYKNKNHILVVEDEPTIREIIGMMINMLGYGDVTYKENGFEAYSSIKEKVEKNKYKPFDLIMTDNDMPKMDGVEFLYALDDLNILNQHRYMLVTGDVNLMKKRLDGLLDKSISTSIQKPLSIENLDYKINNLLKQPIKYHI
jgi:CheY-like chemotaxis protein